MRFLPMIYIVSLNLTVLGGLVKADSISLSVVLLKKYKGENRYPALLVDTGSLVGDTMSLNAKY